jgi:signal transduction histidine kinase
VRYDGSGELDDLALRILQEALTNALKHPPGADVEIDARAGVVVRDHGARTTPTLAATGAGLGLTGLRERVAAAGGTLAAGPAPGGGWELRATTPTEVAQDRH